jgi:hypothetical protein
LRIVAARLSGLIGAGLALCLVATDAMSMPEPASSKPIGAMSAVGAPPAAFETFLDRLMRAESSGRDDAENPRSTALGAFQFIKATFMDVVRRCFAAEIASLSEEAILALRTNREFARRAAAAYTKENMAFLVEQGLTPTFGHLRLAFLVGPSAAVRLLQAEPDTPARDVLGAAAVRANPFVRRMSASDLIARAALDISAEDRPIAVSPRPIERTVEPKPPARVSPRPKAGATEAQGSAKKAGPETATCNRRLASCRRWVALREPRRAHKAGRGRAERREAIRRSSKRPYTRVVGPAS